jgi:hypothetical protein
MQKAIQLRIGGKAHFWAFPERSVGEFEGVCTILVLVAQSSAVRAIKRCVGAA